jgi:preprotein translocase subunit YajC
VNVSALLFAQDNGGGSSLGLIILLLPIAAIIFLTVVPQRKQRRKQAELMGSLEVGDEVVTIGGIHGVVNHIEDDVVHLEVDDDVVMKFGLGAVSRKAGEPDPAAKSSGGILGALTGAGQRSANGAGDDSGDGDDADADSASDKDA